MACLGHKLNKVAPPQTIQLPNNLPSSFQVASMMTRRLGVAVAVLNGYLYAIGGSDGQCPLNTVERYDPRKNQWAPMAPMSTRRKHLGCAVFNNMIYAGISTLQKYIMINGSRPLIAQCDSLAC